MNSKFILFFSFFVFAISLDAQIFYHTGSDADIETEPIFGILLAGGATDNDDGMTWLAERADGGDVVVLRASGSDGYNDYIYSQLGVEINSVTSIVIQSEEEANNPEVCEAVENAELIFIAGGNQWNYYDHWLGTCLQTAINAHVNEKSAPIGGTSAGLAVLGEVIFSAENGSVWSQEALENPYHFRIKLEKDFLDVPFMQEIVTDSHYNAIYGDDNNRHGRHLTFMARMISDWEMDAKGIGVNEYTAVAVDENGLARVFGHPSYDDYAYFLKTNSVPEVCEDGQHLTWYHEKKAVSVYKLKGDFTGSGTFDLTTWENGEEGNRFYWYVQNGNLAYAAEITFEIIGDIPGILEAESDGLPLTSGDAASLELPVTFYAYPEEGYRVKQWIVNDVVQDEISQIFVVNSLENKIHIQVEFMEIPAGTFMVNFFPTEGNGSLNASIYGEEILNGASVNSGSDILFTALPDEGYDVMTWMLNGNIIDDENNEPFTGLEYLYENLDSNINVTIKFTETDPVIEEGIFLMWDAASTANTPQYREEYYSVWISTEGTQPGDFTMIFDETLDSEIENWVHQARNIDISEWTSQSVHIAFRHHESTDKDRIMINNVKILLVDEENEEPVIILDEDFQAGIENGNGSDPDPDWLPEDWASVDLDDDGHNWYYASFENDGYMLSRSWVSNTPLTPDNWLITKQIVLGEDPGTGIRHYSLTDNEKIMLYPNPANNQITLENLHYLKIQDWKIFSLDGRRIISAPNTLSDNQIIDIEILKPGFYIIKVMFEDNTSVTLRFVKGL
ncbi:MAG: choice-of-anchor J domain-containing protein [Bacteroidales bacterium]